ncbi:Hypothetical_protein [Hexamita inflata]|uniref:Hypothetical_protein n=1 Tax=Hexamita inflata TaxID=28002 RepID=A0AA86UYB2_9EUKA|nr:Hypothetical protein HINF_LOCUS64560 [Hexamita inflata]
MFQQMLRECTKFDFEFIDSVLTQLELIEDGADEFLDIFCADYRQTFIPDHQALKFIEPSKNLNAHELLPLQNDIKKITNDNLLLLTVAGSIRNELDANDYSLVHSTFHEQLKENKNVKNLDEICGFCTCENGHLHINSFNADEEDLNECVVCGWALVEEYKYLSKGNLLKQKQAAKLERRANSKQVKLIKQKRFQLAQQIKGKVVQCQLRRKCQLRIEEELMDEEIECMVDYCEDFDYAENDTEENEESDEEISFIDDEEMEPYMEEPKTSQPQVPESTKLVVSSLHTEFILEEESEIC